MRAEQQDQSGCSPTLPVAIIKTFPGGFAAARFLLDQKLCIFRENFSSSSVIRFQCFLAEGQIVNDRFQIPSDISIIFNDFQLAAFPLFFDSPSILKKI